MKTTLGIKNKNPWNVKNGRPMWKGSTDSDERGHAIFKDEAFSARATIRTLAKKFANGKTTLLEIFESYAPVEDDNNPFEYADFVSHKAGVDAHNPLRLFGSHGEIINFVLLTKILTAMAEFENYAGYQVSLDAIERGVEYYEIDFVREWAG